MATLDATTALSLAQEAYSASTSYFDTSIRRQIEQDIRQFQGQHPPGSKYLSDAYRARSRLFRPKTRSAVRKHEAVAAEAFFSTRDVLNVEPLDESDPVHAASAELTKELLQYRLTKTIPWFLTLMGAYQDSQVAGLVCSEQCWWFDKKKGIDKPNIRLLPIENVRFDPGADWMDPVNTSPYFIEMIPMYVKDVRARATVNNEKTREKRWKPVDESQLLKAVKGYSDTIRLTREQGRTDSKENQNSVKAYNIVWVHKNIVEHDGVDYVYYTLGDFELLSDPVPLEDVYWHGRRPYVIGYSVLETHKNYPGGPVRLTRDVQAEINETANLRIDNVRLAMNKRYLVARGKQVDLRSLTRGIAGSVTLVNNIESDVKELEFNDVTASAYKEQEVLNLDFDETSGNFSQGSVQSNRKLNETATGMTLLSTDANQVSGYQLRTFVETWVEPVLRQLVLLEQHYETDEVILGVCGKKAQLLERFNVDRVTDELLEQEMTLTVSVGMGATNPQEKVNRFLTALRSISEILNQESVLLQYGLKVEEVIKEVMGNLGYRDGTRFIDMGEDEDPRVKQLQQQVQQLQQALDAKHPPELLQAMVKKTLAEADAAVPKAALAQAQATKTNVDASYSAMQTAEVLVAVPAVAAPADAIMKAAQNGNQNPDYPAGAGGGSLATQPIENHRTGTVMSLPGSGQPGGPASGDTSPQTPAAPAAAGTGAAAGIHTMRPDGQQHLANGGMVRYANGGVYRDVDPLSALNSSQQFDGATLDEVRNMSTSDMTPIQRQAFNQYAEAQNRRAYPEAYGAKTHTGNVVEEFGGGHLFSSFADGGVIAGPGTGTSDSVPAVTGDGQPAAVSNGEFKLSPQVVAALGADWVQALIQKYHQPVAGQPGQPAGPAQVVLEDGSAIIPADVVQLLGPDFFEELEKRYGGAAQ